MNIAKQDRRLSRTFHLFVLVLALLVPATLAQAQSSSGISVAPTLIEKPVAPGDKIDDQLHITNKDTVRHTYYLSVKDITDILQGGVPVVATGAREKTGFELSSWVTIGASSVTIDAGASQYVPIKILVPQTTSPGAHFGEVFVSLQPQKTDVNGAGAGVGYDIGTIISLRVAGKTVDNAELHEFRAESFLYSSPHITFLTTLVNSGNTLLRPVGTLGVTDMFGKKVATLDVNGSGGALIPGGRRTFQTVWDDQGFAFGKYTASVAFSYGEGSEGKKTVYGDTTFWILPGNILVPVLFSVLIIGLLIYVGTRSYVKRQLRGHGGSVSHAGRSRHTSTVTVVLLVALLFAAAFLIALFFLFA